MIVQSRREDVAILTLTHGPVNALDLELCRELRRALVGLDDEGAVRAVILTGGERAFSAGVDLFRVLDGGAPYLDEFLDALDGLFSTVADFGRPVVAAVNGHAIAGGAVLALACDYRVMSRGTFGLPELRVGVPFPRGVLAIVRSAVPRRHLREVVLRGRVHPAARAHEMGLVDELAGTEELLDRAFEIAAELGALPSDAFALTRRLLREPPAATADSEAAARLDAEIAAAWNAPETHARIRDYLERTLGRSSR